LSGTIVSVDIQLEVDNPRLNIVIQDDDGDHHAVVVQVIQRIDEEAV
jgi:hypothetical protein